MKNIILFLLAAMLIVVAALAYKKYCASLPEGCQETSYDDRGLDDDHMDNV